MNKQTLSLLILAIISFIPSTQLKADFGGNFVGSFAGSLIGSAIGTSVANSRHSRSSRYHGEDCECRRCLRQARIERARAQEARAIENARQAREERRRLERERRHRRHVVTYVYEPAFVPAVTYVEEVPYYGPAYYGPAVHVHEYNTNPGVAFGCGLVGFGLGAALGSALN